MLNKQAALNKQSAQISEIALPPPTRWQTRDWRSGDRFKSAVARRPSREQWTRQRSLLV